MAFLKIFSSEWLTKLIGTTEFNSKTKTRYQRKVAAANIAVNGAYAPFQFNNLEIGKAYRLKMHFRCGNLSNDTRVTATNGAEIIGHVFFDVDGGGSLSTVNESTVEFIATATTIIFTVATASSTPLLVGTNALDGSYVTLEELPNHEQTSQWT